MSISKNLWKQPDYKIKQSAVDRPLFWEKAKNSFRGKTHTTESKIKISQSCKGLNAGSKNSQFNTCWITNEIENKKIKIDDLVLYETQGWRRGRK